MFDWLVAFFPKWKIAVTPPGVTVHRDGQWQRLQRFRRALWRRRRPKHPIYAG
jgi:hypothetical protein